MSGALGLLRARQAIASAVHFFDVTAFFEFSNDAREKPPAVMPQAQAVGNFPDARWLRLLGKISDHLFGRNFGRESFLLRIGRVTLVGAAHSGTNRLTDLLLRG